MLYAVICYNSEAVVGAWSKEKDDAVMEHHKSVLAKFAANGKLGPVARLMPTTTATTVRTGREMMVLDGPFAETKEQMLGFYLFECDTLDEVIAAARELVSDPGAMEIRPVKYFNPGNQLLTETQ
jgi:hypothetical protein